MDGEGVGATVGDLESRGMKVKYRTFGTEDLENGAHGDGTIGEVWNAQDPQVCMAKNGTCDVGGWIEVNNGARNVTSGHAGDTVLL